MILYYAMGGGLGHLTRAYAVLHTLQCTTPVMILSSSPFVTNVPVPDGMRVYRVPAALAQDRDAYQSWLAHLLTELQPTALYLDVFPAGIVGELGDFPALDDLPVHYVARRLRWDTYARQLHGRMPQIHSTFLLEPLEESHLAFINTYSIAAAPLSLIDPPRQLSTAERAILERVVTLADPVWLLVHSGNAEEVGELVAYAEELRRCEGSPAQLLVAAPEHHVPALSVHAQSLGLFPAHALFPYAERVISGCGFNMMRQMASFRHKHDYLPFARRFDDQYWRAAYWRRYNGEMGKTSSYPSASVR